MQNQLNYAKPTKLCLGLFVLFLMLNNNNLTKYILINYEQQ
jgi:hypothetical protein